MRNLIATKPLVYATRRLKAGEGFIARSSRDARVLVAIGKAVPGIADAVQMESDEQEDDVVLPTLRAEYEAIVGKRPFMGWDAEQLTKRIATAKASNE